MILMKEFTAKNFYVKHLEFIGIVQEDLELFKVTWKSK